MPAGCDDEPIYQIKEFDDVLTVLGIARVTPLFRRDALVQFVLRAEHATLVNIP